jgi:hypothetical protein
MLSSALTGQIIGQHARLRLPRLPCRLTQRSNDPPPGRVSCCFSHRKPQSLLRGHVMAADPFLPAFFAFAMRRAKVT